MSRDQINIRCGMDLKMILMQMDNYSEFSRDAILEKLDRENNSLYIDSKIREHQKIINELQSKKQSVPTINNKINDILKQSLQKFKQRNNEIEISDSQNRDWIKKSIIPDLRKTGCRLDEYKLLEMFKSGRVDV